jgi:hypothetical protein
MLASAFGRPQICDAPVVVWLAVTLAPFVSTSALAGLISRLPADGLWDESLQILATPPVSLSGKAIPGGLTGKRNCHRLY